MTATPKRAILYLPGVLAEITGDSALALANRIARALDRSDPVGANRYEVANQREFAVGDLPTRQVRIFRISGESRVPVVDVLGFRYPTLFLSRFRSSNPVIQALRVLLIVVGRTGRVLMPRMGRVSKGLKERLQIFYGAVFLFLLALYVPFLLATAIDAFVMALPASWPGDAVSLGSLPVIGGVLEGAVSWWDGHREGLHATALTVVAFGVLLKRDLKALWMESAGYTVPAAEYLRHGAHGGVVRGQFADLLERLAEDEELEYEALEVWGYSLGSVIALDLLFPPEGQVVSERLHLVDRLVTLGAPIGFVNIFFPSYFKGRGRIGSVTEFEWINVFSPQDLLATSFGTDRESDRGSEARSERPDFEISYAENHSALGWWRLGGFSAHQGYWDQGVAEGDHNVVDLIVSKRELGTQWLP